MKLLRVTASHFKNACDHFSIDLLAKSRKTAEDKEYELQEIADGLFISRRVLQRNISSVYEKTGTKSRIGLFQN